MKVFHFKHDQLANNYPGKKSGPSSVTENGPKTKKAYPKTSLDKVI